MDLQVAVPSVQRVNVVDRLVLTSLEFGFIPFENIERLLNDESFTSKEWFPTLSFGRQRISFSLLRLIKEGLVECRPDSRVDGPVIASPDRTHISRYWFSPTPAGETILTHTAPWDLELSQCQLPSERTTTWHFIEEFRKNPALWDYRIASRAREPNQTLIGWTSYGATLVHGGFKKVATHVVEITQSRPLKALQAHFRPLGDDTEISTEPITIVETTHRLGLLDLLLLDILTVDLESLPMVMHILNHESSPYSAWLPGRTPALRDVRRSAARLVTEGYAVSYSESTNGALQIETNVRSRVDQSDLWLGITPRGVQAINQQWRSAFSKPAASKSKD